MGKVCLEEVPGQIRDLLEMLCLCAVSGTYQHFPSRAGGRGSGCFFRDLDQDEQQMMNV